MTILGNIDCYDSPRYSNKFINIFFKYNDFIFMFYNYYFEYNKFKNYYIERDYNFYKLYIIEYYNYLHHLHREDGPAWIEYHENNKIFIEQYFLNNRQYPYKIYNKKINKVV